MFVNTTIINRHNDDCNVKFLKNKWSVPGFQLLSPLPEWNRIFIETFETLKHLVYITWAVWLDDINFSLRDPLNILGHILDCLRTFGTLLGISADTIRFFSAKWVEQNRDFSLKISSCSLGPCNLRLQAEVATLLKRASVFTKSL